MTNSVIIKKFYCITKKYCKSSDFYQTIKAIKMQFEISACACLDTSGSLCSPRQAHAYTSKQRWKVVAIKERKFAAKPLGESSVFLLSCNPIFTINLLLAFVLLRLHLLRPLSFLLRYTKIYRIAQTCFHHLHIDIKHLRLKYLI